MKTSQKVLLGVVAAVAVLALVVGSVALVGGNQQAATGFGGVTTGTAFPHGISVGTQANSATNIASVWVGTGSLIGPNYTSLAASTTLPFDIAVSGVQSGDVVFAQFATSTQTGTGAGWLVTQASASSTAGYITLRVLNNTGAAATIPQSVASTTEYLIARTQ